MQLGEQILTAKRQRHPQPVPIQPPPKKQHLHLTLQQRALLPILFRRQFLKTQPAVQCLPMHRQRKEHPLPMPKELGEEQDQQGRDLALCVLPL